jgi:iron complex transport system substrate-binding protein
MARRVIVLLALMSVTAAGCGDAGTEAAPPTTQAGAGTETTEPPDEFPVEVAGVSIPTRPERIVSGSSTHTEILFAIGAGPQVVAVDLWSDYPQETADRERVDAFNASVEAISELDPDLVILTFDPGGIVDGLAVLGIPVLVLDAPADLEGVFAQYADIGVTVGRVAEAASLVEQMRADIDAIVGSLPDRPEQLTYYHELDPLLYTMSSNTFLGHLYGLLGMRSIADGVGSDWPQLSAEFIFDADPDLIFLACALHCGVTAESIRERPGWDRLTAVSERRVYEVDESMASRWGPRIVDLLRSVAGAVLEAAP